MKTVQRCQRSQNPITQRIIYFANRNVVLNSIKQWVIHDVLHVQQTGKQTVPIGIPGSPYNTRAQENSSCDEQNAINCGHGTLHGVSINPENLDGCAFAVRKSNNNGCLCDSKGRPLFCARRFFCFQRVISEVPRPTATILSRMLGSYCTLSKSKICLKFSANSLVS